MLGVSKKSINKTIFMQTLVYFSIPVVLAFVHSIVGIKVTNTVTRLRKKLDGLGIQNVIETRRGLGYIIESMITTTFHC